MMDFTEIAKNNLSYRAYGGANGIKRGILLNNEPYMLKIELRNKKSGVYTNSILSEYIASKIYSMFIPTQEVILGKIEDNNRDKLCVACKDFKKENEYLYEFINIKNSVLSDNTSNGTGTDLEELLKAIEEQKFCKVEDVKKRFWDMFVIDSYLGNFDRHNGNWGILVNEKTKETRLAPIYDCGSCLYPGATDEELKFFLTSKEELEKRIFIFPNSAIREENQKLNYYKFLTNTTNEDCLKSIRDIVPQINKKTKEIENFINGIDILSDVRKEFYCKILDMRREKILEVALERSKSLLLENKALEYESISKIPKKEKKKEKERTR